jgi:hypothetical protein
MSKEASYDSEWLRHAIRFVLKSESLTSSSDEARGPSQQRDPRFRKLVEGVLYSKKFILTYHVAILFILAIFTAVHWSEKAYTWRRRRRLTPRNLSDYVTYDADANYKGTRSHTETMEETEASSSGSSTLEGTETPPHQMKDVNEDTPLLHSSHILASSKPRRSLITYLQSLLIYQPRPIPLVNKTLPFNGYTILITAFILLNVFYTVFHINFTLLELFVLADRCALVFVANLPLLYLFAAKTQPIKLLTGYSYESLNILHRRLGELLCLEAVIHGIGMMGVWYTILRPSGMSLWKFLFENIIWLGLAALFTYELLYLTSLASFRQLCYELFLGLHVLLQAAALVFVFFHHSSGRVYVGIALGIFLIDRLVYRIWFKSKTVASIAEVMEDGDTVRLSANIELEQPGAITSLMGRKITRGWQASDHVFITIPSLGRKHALQAHPFTIISPASTVYQKEAKLDLLIRAQDGFSADLLKAALQRKSFILRLDGPYGSHHARALLQNSDVALIIAGGSGIAVAWPLVNFLLENHRLRDAEVAVDNPQMRRKIYLVWIVHRSAHLSWIGWPALQELRDRGVEVIVPRATEEAGRPDLEYTIRSIVSKAGDGQKVGVVGSGPDSMGRSIRNSCAKMVRDGRNVSVTIEKFGW